MARPKKKKIIVVIVVILSLADANLANGIVDSIEEIVGRQLTEGIQIFDGDPEGETWDKPRQDVFDAMEAIADDPTGANHVNGLQGLSDELATALAQI